jgi:L-lactate dehydrogenase (cytochrome)
MPATGSTRAAGWLTRRRLARAHNVADLRFLARRRLPRAAFDYLDGGAEDEVTLARNREAFDRWAFVPRTLVDVGKIDLTTRVLGQRLDLPLLLAPCGLAGLLHRDGEVAAARAAHRAGTVHVLSTMGSTSIEDLAGRTDGPLWYQIYVWRDRGLLRGFLERAREHGYRAVCLTVDSPVVGHRDRDLRGNTDPPRVTVRTALDACRHPAWTLDLLRGPPLGLPNVLPGVTGDLGRLGRRAAENYDPGVSWSDLEWMVQQWNGPFAIKGIQCAADAVRAVDCGVGAVIVSNHGGRQLDHAPASLEVLPEIVDAVGDRAEILLDSGVRRGSDVVKALALGARACLVGRAYLYGLAAGGEAGVARALSLLRAEIERVLALIGCSSPADLDPSWLRPHGPALPTVDGAG